LYSLLEVHALPIFLATINSAILDSAPASSQSFDADHVSGTIPATPFMSGGIYVAIAYVMPATTVIAFAVRDRELRTKHQLSVMGIRSLCYWGANFVHDSLLYSVTVVGSILIFATTKTEPQGGDGMYCYVLLCLLYVLNMTLFCYVLSFIFESHHIVYQIVPLAMQFTSIGALIAVMILMAIPSANSAGELTSKICIWLLPHYR
jgi:hypothetical protein